MGAIRDVWDVGINIVVFVAHLIQKGWSKKQVNSLLRELIANQGLSKDPDEIIAKAEKYLGEKDVDVILVKSTLSKVRAKKKAAKRLSAKRGAKKQRKRRQRKSLKSSLLCSLKRLLCLLDPFAGTQLFSLALESFGLIIHCLDPRLLRCWCFCYFTYPH